MKYAFLLGALEAVLGKGVKRSKSNYGFNCPVCNHPKKKLEVRLESDEEGKNPWGCWVCGPEGTRGRTIYSLLKKVKASREHAVEVLKYVKKGTYTEYRSTTETLTLPEGFTPLYKASKTSIIVNRYKRYLYSRGVTDYDILKYKIGYCTKGEYKDRIIFPSYTRHGTLNFYVGKSIDKKTGTYSNPDTGKDLIFYENMINWKKPVVICEGVFDAIAIKRNAIPLLGKYIGDQLKTRLIEEETPEVYIALDAGETKTAEKHHKELSRIGVKVRYVEVKKKDPGEEGFENMCNVIREAEELTFRKILELKLEMK